MNLVHYRTRIKLGNHSFSPNIGVAQGSGISPFLFNIYAEDLYYTLEKEADINYKDLMGYPDVMIDGDDLVQIRSRSKSGTIRSKSDSSVKLGPS